MNCITRIQIDARDFLVARFKGNEFPTTRRRVLDNAVSMVVANGLGFLRGLPSAERLLADEQLQKHFCEAIADLITNVAKYIPLRLVCVINRQLDLEHRSELMHDPVFVGVRKVFTLTEIETSALRIYLCLRRHAVVRKREGKNAGAEVVTRIEELLRLHWSQASFIRYLEQVLTFPAEAALKSKSCEVRYNIAQLRRAIDSAITHARMA